MSSGNAKAFDSKLLDHLNKEVDSQAKSAGKKIVDQRVEENLTKFEEHAESHSKGIREKMKQGILKFKLNLHATVLFLLCLQLLVSFFLLLLLELFSFVLALVLLWVLMFVGCIYCGSYCLISKYPAHFKKSSSTFVMNFVLAVCEGVVLCFMSMPISSTVFLVEVSMVIMSLFMAAMLAKCLRGKYRAKAGLMIAILTTASMYIIFFFALSSLRVWMTVCTLLVCAYQWFLIFRVSGIIKELEESEEDDKFQTGLYASLLIFKAKLDLFVNIGKFVYEKCCKKKEPPIEAND